MVTVLALLAVVVPAWSAPSATSATSTPAPASTPALSAALIASAPTVPTGGTFGYKFSPTIEALLGVACMATGKPVFLNFDYFQKITYTGKRSPFFINLKMGADKEGKILAMESDWSCDHGPYSEFGDLVTLRGAQFIGAGYGIPNIC